MQPLKITIPGQFWDSYIYSGRLYLFGLSGDIRSLHWEQLIRTWNVPDRVRIALICAFLRSDYLYGIELQDLLRDTEIKSLVTTKFANLSRMQLEVSSSTLLRVQAGRQDNPCPFPHADLEIYKNNLYVASPSGVTRATCNKKTKYPISTRPEKKWDAPILGLSASYGTLALAAGSEGLYEMTLDDDYLDSFSNLSGRPFQLNRSSCRDCNWTYYSIFASSDTSGFLAQYSKWIDGNYDRNAKPHFDGIETTNALFGSSGFSWGVQDKLCQAVPNGIKVIKYTPWADDGRFRDLGTVGLASWKGEIVSATVASFGVVVELENAIVVYPSEGDPITLRGEPVNWRVFNRSKHYENQLHVVYEDRLEILSFNHDYLVDQEQKILGTSYFPRRSSNAGAEVSLGNLLAL